MIPPRDSRESAYRAFADGVADPVVVYDRDLRILYFNEALRTRLGVDGTGAREAGSLWPEQQANVQAVLRDVIASRAPRRMEAAHRSATGTRSLAISVVPLCEASGEVSHVVAIAHEVADQRLVEEAHQARVAANEQLARIAASVPGAVYTFRLGADGQWSIPFATGAIEDLYGLPRAALATDMTEWLARLDPPDRERLATSIAVASVGPSPWHETHRYNHPTKGTRWIEGWSLPVRERNGDTLWHGFLMDVTDRVKADQRVVRLGRLYRTLSDTNEAIVRATDRDALLARVCAIIQELGNIWWVWVALASDDALVHAVSAGPGSHLTHEVRIPLDTTKARVPSFAADAFRTGEPRVVNDFRATESAKTWKSVASDVGALVALPIREAGSVVGVMVIATTEAGYFDDEIVTLLVRLAEDVSFGLDGLVRTKALKDSEEQYRTLVEDSPDLIMLIGMDKRCLFQNNAVRRYGVDPATRLGAHYLTRVHPDDQSIVERAWDEALAGRPATAETRVVFSPEKTSTFRFRLRAVFDGDRPTAMRLVATDVTQQREVEEQLRTAQKMEAVGRLAGGIAHDFNNLLSVIGSYTDLALDSLREEDPLRTDLDEIRAAARRAATLTSQLLAFSRKQFLRPRVIDLDALVSGTSAMLRRVIGEDVDLVVVPSRQPARILADPGQVEQVLMNLAVNARDAMPKGGTLTIETRRNNGHVALIVTDTGTGMDAATQSRIFEPFFTTKPVGQGTGLGLSTVYGIVEQSGGRIEVKSEPGKGSAFNVFLPSAGADEDVPASAQVAAVPGGTETVLVVEDDDAVRRLAQRILVRAGYSVLVASNAGEALLVAEQRPSGIDLLLTDVVMPTMSGRELADRLATTHPKVRVLYMSGYTDDAVIHRGVQADGRLLVNKPFTPEELARRVRGALDNV